MRRLKRAAFASLSGFSLVSLVVGARRALQQDAAEGWSEVGLDWLVLKYWSELWSWELGLVGALLGFLLGWAYGRELPEGQRAGPLSRMVGVLAHPLVVVLLFFATRYGPGFSAQTWKPRLAAEAPNVVVVVVDTWRADHTSFLGYGRATTPGLERLAQSGAVFERAKAQSGWTKPSVATLLTGMLPSQHLAISQPSNKVARRGVNLARRMHTLSEVFLAKGWQTGMWSNNPNIMPERGFAQGAESFVDYRRHPKRTEAHDPGRSEFMLPDVKRWIEGRRDRERPFAAYLHIMDPHLPYEAPAPFGGRFDKSGLDFQIGPRELQDYQSGKLTADDVTPAMLKRIKDAYDEELAYVDHHLASFLTYLMEEEPNTLIVVVGDHGEEFLEHGQFGHAHAIYEELVHVPLVIWGPGIEAQRIPYQVRLMDVMPSLFELTQLEGGLSIDFQGRSLVPLLRGEESAHRLAPMETGGEGHPNFHWRGLSDGRHKLLRREQDPPAADGSPTVHRWESTEQQPYFRLYDLEQDPGEVKRLEDADPERAQALFELLQERGWYVAPEELLGGESQAHAASDAEMEDLKSLGYGGGEEEDE